MSTSLKKNSESSKVNTAAVSEAGTLPGEGKLEKIVEENTPGFVSKGLTVVGNNLEAFRVNYFNSQYIFYPILAIVLFILLRYLWRKFF